MSTKTTFKRVALVTVAALSFGTLTAVAPATAAIATGLVVSAGPNNTTNSVTVVGAASRAAGVLVRLDVTSNDTSTAGLSTDETIKAAITAVPTSVTAKTLAANGGAITDTAAQTSPGTKPDLILIETANQAAGTAPAAKDSVTNYTDWTKIANGAYTAAQTNWDSTTAGVSTNGVITHENNGYLNRDGRADNSTANYTKSYYVTVLARESATVVDQGAYTITFTLLDKDGNVRSTQTLKVDFVSSKSVADAKLSIATSGTFIAAAALSPAGTTGTAFATMTLTNRDGGAIRSTTGAVESPTVSIQDLAKTPVADTMTVASSDFGSTDFGNSTDKNQVPQNGVYGLTATLPATASTTTQLYQFYALYGNATPATGPFTLFSATATANAANTDVLVTAAGMSTTDQAERLNIGSTTANFTLPTTTTSATLKFSIQTGSNVAVGAAVITATPSWSGTIGTAQVTPAASATGTAYTTDALGNFSLTVTNSAPVKGAVATIVLTGAAAFGNSKNTVTLTWDTPAASTIVAIDPVADVSVLSGSTNVTTVLVRDQFGNPVSGQNVTVSVAQTPAIVLAAGTVATVISPIITGADGRATYSFTPAAATTSATITFNTAPTTVTAATFKYTYVATLPVVATLTPYHGYTWGTADVLTPATGIYTTSSGSTRLVLDDARNISKPLTAAMDTDVLNDEIALRFVGLTSAGVAATGASVTVTAGAGGHIVSPSTGLPVKSATYAVGTSGTAVINVLATGTGAITFTATSGTVTATASMWVAGRLNSEVVTTNSPRTTAGRFITVTSAKTGSANGSGVPVTVAVTDRYGNPVSGVALNVVASGVGSFMPGQKRTNMA